jgi:hypothetical protein
MPSTPAERYGSNEDYKIVIISGEVYLKFVKNDTPPFGPFSAISPTEYEYRERGKGVRSVALVQGVWLYSNSYISMSSVKVDATELSLLEKPGVDSK